MASTLPNNSLVNVATYNDAKLGLLQNENCFIGEFNTKYKMFEDLPANLGTTVNIELPNRALANTGLVASFTGVQQLLQPLTCDQAANSSHDFTAQQFIFNVDDYMEKFGNARACELGASIEANVALNANSSVPVMTVDANGQSVPTGALHTESGPFRFFGDGRTPINSFTQLAKMEAIFRNYGAPTGALKVFFDDLAVVDVVGTGLNQFALDRNNELANSWDLGSYKGSNARYFKSNLLPIQIAGTCGNNNDPLVLTNVNDPTGQNVTQLTFSGVSVNTGAFNAGDLIQFASTANNGLVYLTYVGHKPSKNPVQVRVLSSVNGNAGSVTVSITPPLQWQPGLNQNLNIPLTSGMTASALPTHRCGLVVAGEAAYLSMPPLPDERPYDSHTSVDKDTKVSLRNYYGSLFGKNQRGFVTDCLWASTVIPHYSMRVCFPLSQGISA